MIDIDAVLRDNPLPGWTARAVPVFAGRHDTHIGTGEDYDTRTLASIFAMEPGDKDKSAGLAFIPSTWNRHDARCHAVQREHGAFVALTGDIDTGNHPLHRVEALVRGLAGDAARLIYSSPHARPGDRRWRVILPLDVPAPFTLWHDAQTAFFAFMEAQGVTMDRALSLAGQPVYLPNVPAVHHKSGEALRGSDGQPLHYQRAATAPVAPGLRLDTNSIAQAIADLRAKREADDRARDRLRAAAERRRASRPYTDGGSPIAGFNRANAIADLLAGYGYEQSPRKADDWRSPHQTGGTYATRIMDDKWVSLSASDAAAGLGAQCSSGCYGDAFDLFVHFEHGGNRTAALHQLHHERRQALAYEKFGRPAQFEGAR
jgi:hypothetical protein